jgi:hypothetical protein
MKNILKLLPWIVLFLLACNGGGGGDALPSNGTGEMVVQMTDAPLDLNLVAEASLDVSEVKVHVSANGNSGFITLFSGPPITVNLRSLNNGIVKQLADAQLPVGSYHQVRLIITGARLVLTNGNVYSTAAGTINLTSLDTSGLKVFIEPKIDVVSGVSSTLLLDIDLSRTFLPIPSNNPLTATSFNILPVVTAHNLADTGEISGHVFQDDGAGGTIGVDAANVYIQPPGDPDPMNAIAGTATLPDGSFRVIGLLPGTYDVLATKELLQGTNPGQVVTLGNVTTADVTIQ